METEFERRVRVYGEEVEEAAKKKPFNVEDYMGKLPPDFDKYSKVPGLHKAMVEEEKKNKSFDINECVSSVPGTDLDKYNQLPILHKSYKDNLREIDDLLLQNMNIRYIMTKLGHICDKLKDPEFPKHIPSEIDLLGKK